MDEKTNEDVRPIRTFEDDLAQAAKKQHETAISMSVKESDKRRREGAQQSESAKKSSKKPLLYLSIFFIVAGLIIIGYFWYQSRPKQEQRVIIDTLIIADETLEKNTSNLSRQDFIDFANSVRSEQKDFGTITHIKLLSGSDQITGQELLELLGTAVPSVLARSMNGDSMFGFIQLQEFSAPFWIVEVDSFENAFGGILEWESSITNDLGPIFSQNTLPTNPTFGDKVSKNKDIRILVNEQNREILIHTFLDQNTLLITEKEAAFQEILPLFISSKQIR